jgi:hypothetical protein
VAAVLAAEPGLAFDRRRHLGAAVAAFFGPFEGCLGRHCLAAAETIALDLPTENRLHQLVDFLSAHSVELKGRGAGRPGRAHPGQDQELVLEHPALGLVLARLEMADRLVDPALLDLLFLGRGS